MNHEENALKIVSQESKKDFLGHPVINLVWACKTLQNWKGILAIPAGPILYEVTYDGDREMYYVDRYQKYGKGAYRLDELEDQR